MSDEKFLLEYEKLLDKGYCDCNEMNCIDNDSPRRILRIAKSLQQENKELKKQLEKKYEKLGTLTAEILYEENTRLANEITVLKTENQKLKEMQCTFLGTGCQNKMKKYKEVIDKVNKLIAENSEKYWIDDEGEPKYLFNEIRDILSEVE